MSDLGWDFINTVLPNKSHRASSGWMIADVINGIFYVLRIGTPWRDPPNEHGLYTTIYNRFNR